MNNYINKWLFFELLYYKDEFQIIDNTEFVHPNERNFVKTNLTNTLYHCIGVENEYLVVKSKNKILRIKSDIIKGYLPTPKFKWGDIVYEIGKPNTKAVIDDLFWHHNKQQFIYYLKVDGKKKTKHYRKDDLRKW